MPDPDLDLDALDALCAAATAGPWVDDVTDVGDLIVKFPDDNYIYLGEMETTVGADHANAAFIAAARTALPALVARVRALAQENATLQAENTMLHGQHWHLHATMIE